VSQEGVGGFLKKGDEFSKQGGLGETERKQKDQEGAGGFYQTWGDTNTKKNNGTLH